MKTAKKIILAGLAAATLLAIPLASNNKTEAAPLPVCQVMPTVANFTAADPFTVTITSNPCNSGVEAAVGYYDAQGAWHTKYGNEVYGFRASSTVKFAGRGIIFYYRYYQNGKWIAS